MNILEKISFEAQPISKTFTPFKKWDGSPLKDYSVVLEIISVGEQIKIGRAVATEPMTSLEYVMKIQLLAHALKSINNAPIVSEDELRDYRKSHKTSDDFSTHDYTIIFFKKFTEQVINALYFAYEDLQNEYASQLMGKPLPNALKLKKEKSSEVNSLKTNTEKDVQDEKPPDATGS